jgi:hypothetical protein
MRSNLQNDIDEACQKLRIPAADFSPLPFTTNWHQLEERIYQAFCNIAGKGRPRWLWEKYKNEWYGLSLKDYPDNILDQLVPNSETVWFMAYDGDNFFFYQGKVKAIQQVLFECSPDEYYLINKKYEWLLNVNHHDYLTGTGAFIIHQLKSFAQRSPEMLIAAYPA